MQNHQEIIASINELMAELPIHSLRFCRSSLLADKKRIEDIEYCIHNNIDFAHVKPSQNSLPVGIKLTADMQFDDSSYADVNSFSAQYKGLYERVKQKYNDDAALFASEHIAAGGEVYAPDHTYTIYYPVPASEPLPHMQNRQEIIASIEELTDDLPLHSLEFCKLNLLVDHDFLKGIKYCAENNIDFVLEEPPLGQKCKMFMVKLTDDMQFDDTYYGDDEFSAPHRELYERVKQKYNYDGALFANEVNNVGGKVYEGGYFIYYPILE